MVSLTLPSWSLAAVVVLLIAATYTDLRWRRIPNVLTFPAIATGLLVYGVTNGWQGLLLSLSGALLSPCLVSLMHGGRGPGMGDLKLAAAVGALLGPILGTAAMLLSMIVGGVVALGWAMKEWGMFGHGRISNFVGRLYSTGRSGGRKHAVEPGPDAAATTATADAADAETAAPATLPYGVALAVGTLITLAVCQWTGSEPWLFCFAIG